MVSFLNNLPHWRRNASGKGKSFFHAALIGAVLGTFPAFSSPASGNPHTPCMSPQAMEAALAEHKESVVAIGVTGAGGLVQVYTSAEGTWTLVITTGRGMACAVAAGEGWQTRRPEPEGPVT